LVTEVSELKKVDMLHILKVISTHLLWRSMAVWMGSTCYWVL